MPGRQDELIRRVAAVNNRTLVVVNAGSPVAMEWASDVAAVLQCWFGGQEMGAALTDVLVGATEPGGRLPITIPMRVEHSPSHANFPGENGELRYGEGLFMGYRGFEHSAIVPRFSFGHGLSYTTFQIGEPTLSADSYRPGETLTVSVPVTNTGAGPRRIRGRPVLCGAGFASLVPPAQRAQGIRQGVARSWRDNGC